ncbi:MAG: hypothetical protein ABI741_05250 [Ferruginibacter sp.]
MKFFFIQFLSGAMRRDQKLIIGSLLLVSVNSIVIYGQPITSIAYASKSKTLALTDSADILKTYAVSGKVTQTFSYCGGAAPSQDILEELAKPVAYAGKKFYIRRGEINDTKNKVIKSFTTGKDGDFCIRLAPGTYAIILEEQLDTINIKDYTKPDQLVDEQCMLSWWTKPYYLLKVKDSNIRKLNFSFFHRCFISIEIPCISYQGPQPL